MSSAIRVTQRMPLRACQVHRPARCCPDQPGECGWELATTRPGALTALIPGESSLILRRVDREVSTHQGRSEVAFAALGQLRPERNVYPHIRHGLAVRHGRELPLEVV